MIYVKNRINIYMITLKRGQREYKFKFGQSIFNSVRFIVYSKDGKKFYNDLNKARRENGVLSLGDYKQNKDFEEPSAYDVLASITKYEPEEFKDFCASYGYEDDSRKAYKIYEAVKEEYNNIKMLYSDEEINKLQEIN